LLRDVEKGLSTDLYEEYGWDGVGCRERIQQPLLDIPREDFPMSLAENLSGYDS